MSLWSFYFGTDLGEFIIDLRGQNLKTLRLDFDGSGNSMLEAIASGLISGINFRDLEVYVALSFDDRIYDELQRVR